MRRGIVVLLAVVLCGSRCGSTGAIIQKDPAFSRKIWQHKKTAIFPVFLPNQSHISQKDADRKLGAILPEKNSNYINFIVPENVVTLMNDYNIITMYRQLYTTYRQSNRLNIHIIRDICQKIKIDAVVITKILKEVSGDYGTFEKSDYRYFVRIETRILDVHTGKIIYLNTTTGRYDEDDARYPKNSLGALLDLAQSTYNIFVTKYNYAYQDGIKKIARNLHDKFIGECSDGNCQEGSGTLLFYGDNYQNRGDVVQRRIKYQGEWHNGYAHGRGVMYEAEKDLKIKYEGTWKKGELKKKIQIYYQKNDEWIPISQWDLNILRENRNKKNAISAKPISDK